MSKVYNKLWVFGDSYTTPGVCVNPADSFWGLTAVALGIKQIINCSRPVNSFVSVQHLLINLHTEIDFENDLIFIGIPPLERITVFDNFKDTEYLGSQIDTETWSSTTFDIDAHRGLMCLQNYGQDQMLVVHSDRAWVETDVMRQIFLLTTWLDNVGANYFVINLSKDFDKDNVWGPSNFVLPYCKNHQRCVLFDNTYRGINVEINKPEDFNQYGWNGHHGPAGNRYFFEKSLLPKLKELNLC